MQAVGGLGTHHHGRVLARCLARALPQVQRLESAAVPEVEQLLRQAKRHAQVVQALGAAACLCVCFVLIVCGSGGSLARSV